LGYRHALCIGRRQINDEPDLGLLGEVATANSQAANFNEAREFARGTDHKMTVPLLKMNPIVPDKHGRGDLPRAAGRDEVECKMRFPGA
jgi:hypothetical protein